MQPSETRREFTNDEATDFTAILTKIKPRTPDAGVQLYAPYSYDAATALIEGMKAADSTDPAKYLPAMQKVDFKGVTGNIAFDAKGDIKEGGVSLYRYADGKWEPLK